jgi:hypothetical protein
MAAGFSGLFLLALWQALGRIRASGAVPEDEFAPAVAAYKAMPFLLGLGLVALAYTAWRHRRPLTVLGCTAVAAAPLLPLALPLGGALLLADALRRLEPGERLPVPTAATWGRVLLGLAALGTVATLLLGWTESLFFVPRFVPDLVDTGLLWSYRLALPGLSFHFGAQMAIFVLGAVLLASLGSRGRSALLGALLGLLAGLGLVFVIWLTMGDEIAQVGIGVPMVVMGLALGWLLHLSVHRRTAGSHRDTLDYAADFFRHGLVPPVRWHTVATLAAGGALFVLLGLLLYPRLEDFRAELFDSYATIATLLALLMLFVVAPRRRYPLVAALVLAVTLAASLTLAANPRVRLVAHEYSRFGALAANSWLERALDPFPTIGEAPGDPPIELGGTLAGGAPLKNRPLIVMLIWDAARADHMSAYGYPRETTPNLARVARESIVFTEARSNATATTASIRMLMTGRYSTRYMLARDYAPFFTKELAELGYKRFVVTVTGSDFNGVSGEAFERGWDSSGVEFVRVEKDHGDEWKPDAPKTEGVLEALRGRPTDATFVYLHLTGSHYPWFDTTFGDTPTDRYDSEILRCDELLGDLLAFLEGREHILIFTADHGTGLGEHGRLAGFFPYEEQIRVPLVLRAPGRGPARIDVPVALVDVAPTLISLFLPKGEHRFHGRSVWPTVNGLLQYPRPTVTYNSFHDAYAIVVGDYKLFHDRGRRYEALFHLKQDPGEKRNLIAEQPNVADELRNLLSDFLYRGRGEWSNPYHYREE